MTHIYWHGFLMSAHEVIGIFAIYVAFGGKFVCGINIEIAWKLKLQCVVLFGLVCPLMWDLYRPQQYYSGTYICDVGGIFVQGHMLIM